MSKIKKIWNLKNSLENLLFIGVCGNIWSVFATLLYLAFNLLNTALWSAKLWATLLVVNVVLFTAIQFCDIWIWKIKSDRNAKAVRRRAQATKKKRVHALPSVAIY